MKPSGRSVRCVFARQGGRTAQPLPSGFASALLVRFDVARNVQRRSLPVRFAVSAPGRDPSTSAAVRIVDDLPRPQLLLAVSGTENVAPGTQATQRVEVMNVGFGPATPSGGPSIVLSELLPASVLGSWSSSGAGWSCSGTVPTCTYSGTVGVGQLPPRLTLRYSLDPIRVAALDLPIGGANRIEEWTITADARGASPVSTARFPEHIAIAPPPGSTLAPALLAVGGVNAVLPGKTTTYSLTLANLGKAATRGEIVARGTIPVGVELTGAFERGRGGSQRRWTCTTSPRSDRVQEFACTGQSAIPAATAAHLLLQLRVAADARPIAGAVTLAARADNQIEGVPERTASAPLIVMPGDVGFPAVALSVATGGAASRLALRPATDGAAAELLTGELLAERLDIRNAGGAAIPAGAEAELVQSLGAGTDVRSIRAPPGWRCSVVPSARPTIRCVVRLAEALAPAQRIQGPTVIVVPTRPTAGEDRWPATVRLTAPGSPKATGHPLLVEVEKAAASLVPQIGTVRLPTAGGTGRFRVVVTNRGTARTGETVRLSLRVPRAAELRQVEGESWNCIRVPRTAVCTSTASADVAARLPPVTFSATFARRTARKTLTITARAQLGDARAPRSATATADVTPRRALRAVITSPATVAFVHEPRHRSAARERSTITLDGDGSGGSGVALRYVWRQRCTTEADARARGSRCRGVTPRVQWLRQPKWTVRPRTDHVTFRVRPVNRLTTLVFQLTVTDGSATSSDVVRVRVVPPTPAKHHLRIDRAKPVKVRRAGPASARRALPAPAQRLRNPEPKRDAAAEAATAAPRTSVANGELPEAFCNIVRVALEDASVSLSFGPISLRLANVRVSGTDCTPDTTISFSDSSIGLSSFLGATDVAGTVSKDGLTLTSGTVETPEAWRAPTLTVGEQGLSLPFSGDSSLAVEGAISGRGFAFVPLPDGWTASTTVRFTVADGATAISVNADARAPVSERSPNSPVPTATVAGSFASDGSFSLTADFDRIVALQGHSIHVSGSVRRPGPGSPIEIELTGSLDEPFDIVPGLRLDALSVGLRPTERSLGLTGEGTILLGGQSDSVGIEVELEYDDPRNWSLKAAGAGTATWQPLPGLTIRPSDVRGEIKAEDNEYEFSLRITPRGTWSPTDAVQISDLALALSNTCDETGAPCPLDAAIYLDVNARAAFELPAVGTVRAALRGALALPSGDFSVAATLENPIEIGAGISIDTGRIVLSRGMPTPAGTAMLAAEQEGRGLRLSIDGSATLPGLGKVPSVEVAFSGAGFTIAAQLGNFPIPGASGDDAKLRNTVVGWSSFDTTLSVVDPVTKKTSTVALPANTFKISASFATPDWLQPLLKLPGDLHGRATGSIDFSSGEFALRAELLLPDGVYVYGNENSASSVRMKSAFFDVALKGADFTLTLGGNAELAIAATDSLPASEVELGVAFGFSAATQTIVGQLSLTSEAGWRSAFGIEDLTMFDLAVDFQLNLTTLTPALGVGARAVLPAVIRDPLGIPDGVQTTVVANISITNPCIGLEINDPARRGGNVLDIARKGVLTATELEIQVAPTGCKVGRFEYKPGLSLNFDGAIAGVPVAVHAYMGLSPFALDAKVDIGAFTIGGLTVHKTSIEIAASPSQLRIQFAGGVDVLGATVELSGGFEQRGATSIIDFRGNLTRLNLGAVNVNQLVVDAHVEAGPSPSVRFTAKGSIDLLGSTADAEFTLGIRNGALESAKADVRARLVIGGAGGLVLNGTFKLDYQPGKTFAVDATVDASVGSFDLGRATISARQSSFTVSANLAIAGVFAAQIDGAVYFGDVPAGSMIAGPGGTKVAARAGDFVLSARDVTLSLGGFSARGTVELGRAGGNVWGNVATRIQLLGSSGDNSIAVSGSFNSNGNFSFRGTGSLNVVGTSAQFDVEVARTGGRLTVHGETTVSVLGSRVALAGDFEYAGGTPRVRLRGAANLNVAGYNLGNGRFTFSNFPSDAGLFAEVDVSAGSVLRASGRLTIVGNRFYLGINANLNLRVLTVPAQVVFTNCTDSTCRTAAPATTLNASASVYTAGFSFAVSVRVSSDGSFTATARSPASGRFYGRTPDIYLLVVAFYANLSYEMQLTISSNSPYVSVRGYGSGDLYGKSWGYRGWFWWGWSGWSHIAGLTASINTNPLEVCGSLRIWGTSFGGCFRG